MFLALHEIYYEKLRYGLIVFVVSLIAFLIFILTALALGLANENTTAINSWKTTSALITKDANGNASQSLLTKKQIDQIELNHNDAIVGISPANVTKLHSQERTTVQFIGLKPDEYIFKSLKLVDGRKPKNEDEVLISAKLKKLSKNDLIKIGLDSKPYKIVGTVSNAEYNMAPVIYGNLNNWSSIKGVNPVFFASAIISKNENVLDNQNKNLSVLTKKQLFDKLPGYTAQNSTFALMIVFLVVISLVIITIFMYILTIQKKANLAVLRAQGIPNSYLISNTFSETFLIMAASISLSAIGIIVVAQIIPSSVPMYFSPAFIIWGSVGIMLTGLIGSVIPMRIISKIDPATVIGG